MPTTRPTRRFPPAVPSSSSFEISYKEITTANAGLSLYPKPRKRPSASVVQQRKLPMARHPGHDVLAAFGSGATDASSVRPTSRKITFLPLHPRESALCRFIQFGRTSIDAVDSVSRASYFFLFLARASCQERIIAQRMGEEAHREQLPLERGPTEPNGKAPQGAQI